MDTFSALIAFYLSLVGNLVLLILKTSSWHAGTEGFEAALPVQSSANRKTHFYFVVFIDAVLLVERQ